MTNASKYHYKSYNNRIMIKYLKLLILFLLLEEVMLSQYDMSHTVTCSNINDNWSFRQNLQYLWGIIILHTADRYGFLIICPLLVMLQCLIIYTFLTYKLYKSTPMDIILAFFVCQLSQNIISFINGIYYTVNNFHQPMPITFPQYCISTAVFLTFFTTLEYVYIFFFLFFVVLSVRKKSIKKNPFYRGKMKHIIALSFSLISTAILYFIDFYGLTQLGVCGVTSTRKSDIQIYFPILQLTISCGFLVSAFLTFRYFKKHVISGNALNRRQYIENLMITKFVVGMSVFLILFSTALIALYYNCISPRPQFIIWATVFNFTKIMQSIYLLIIMFTYQKITTKLKKVLRNLFSKKNNNITVVVQQGKISSIQKDEYFDVGLKQKILDIQQQENQIDFITVSQILSILIGIKITYKEYIVQMQPSIIQKVKNLYFLQEVSFIIHSKLINQYQYEATILPKLTLLKAKFTIYSPKIFQSLINQESLKAIEDSFDLILNRNQLYKIYQSQGGRSGEFFFFTSDHKYILKTVNKQEFSFLLEFMSDFYHHFMNNPHSLISKVYGMFQIDYAQIDQKYYILLMKNISGCSKNQVIRTYDMKGSTHQRKVLKSYDTQDSYEMKKRVLKDLDFVQLQQTIQIDQLYAKNIKNQLVIDTQFLKGLNIIDYSLLVMRVNWLQEPKIINFWGKLNRIVSSINSNEFYHIVLIDYLQKWDKKKQGEKWWKNLFGNKDTSAAEPSKYQSRFIAFIRAIFINESVRNTKANVTQYTEKQSEFQTNRQVMSERVAAMEQSYEQSTPARKIVQPMNIQIGEI